MVLDSAWVRFVLSGSIILRNVKPLRLFMAVILPLNIATLLFSLSAPCGTFLGVRWRVLPLRAVYVLASAIIILTILTTWMSGWYETAHEVWSGGAWHGVSWRMRLLPFVSGKLAGRLPARYSAKADHQRQGNYMNGHSNYTTTAICRPGRIPARNTAS